MNTIELSEKYLAPTYTKNPVAFKSGKGSILYGEDGGEYIDLGSGIAVNLFGMCDGEWTNAVSAQAHTLAHTSNLYYTGPQAALARNLCERTGMKRVFLCNSGAEANEAAIKAARKYSFDKYGPGRSRIVTLKNSFHGRTMATLAATGQDAFHKYFDPFPAGFDYAEANDIADLEQKLSGGDCAALMIELIQGEGGLTVLDADFVKKCAELCTERDILLITDEIQTGMGRTGRLFCAENYKVKPDIITAAKGLGGGLPIGACLLGEKSAQTLGAGTHGSTFGGNPICAAGALCVLERIDETLLGLVREKGERVKNRLLSSPAVEGVSGTGLMLGIKTQKAPADVISACLKKGVLVLSAKDKIRLLPALNIPEDVLERGIDILLEVIEE